MSDVLFDDIEGEELPPFQAPSFDSIEGEVETTQPAVDIADALDNVDSGAAEMPGGLRLYRPGGVEDPRINADQGGRLKVALDLLRDEKVDRMAMVRELSRRTGLDARLVDAQYDSVAKAWEVSGFDEAKFRKQYPWIARLVDRQPGLANIAVKDVAPSQIGAFLRSLNALEELQAEQATENELAGEQPQVINVGGQDIEVPPVLSNERRAAFKEQAAQFRAPVRQEVKTGEEPQGFLSSVVPEYRRNAVGVERSEIEFALMSPWVEPDQRRDLELRLINLEREMIPVEGRDPLAADLTAGLPSTVEVMKAGGVAAVVTGVAAGGATALLSRKPGAGLKVGKLAAGLAGKGAAFLRSFQLESGSAFGTYRHMRLDDGTVLSEDAARGGAVLYGVLSASIELVSLGAQVPALKGIAAAGGLKAFIAAELKKHTFRQLAMRASKQWLAAGGAEAGAEFSQSLLEDVVGYLQRSGEAGEFQEAQPFESFVSASEAGYVGGLGGLTIGGASLGITTAVEVASAGRAQQDAQVLELVSQLQDSPLVQADPKAAAQALTEALVEGGGRKTSGVQVEPRELLRLFQTENTPIETLGQEVVTATNEALLTGGMVEVPWEAYLEHIVRPGHAQKLKNATSLDPTATTEAQQKNAQMVEQLAEKLAKEEGPAESVAEQGFIAAMERQLVATGKATKKDAKTQLSLFRALIRTLPERFGQGRTPDELFQHFAVSVGAGDPTVVGTSSLAQDPLPGAMDALKAEWARLGEGEGGRERQIRLLLLDRNTGLLNQRAFRMLPRDPDRPLLAEFEIEGTKFFNDNYGHASFDGALRLAGGALRKAGINAAQWGGTIRAWVESEQQAEQLAKAVREAVGQEVQITTATAEDPGEMDFGRRGTDPLKPVVKAAGEAHKQRKDAARGKKTLGQRKGAPVAFWPENAPEVDWSDKQDGPGIKLDSPEFKALMEQAKAAGAKTAERFLGVEAKDRRADDFDASNLTDELRAAADQDADWFSSTFLDATGMLTEEGFLEALRLAPKAFKVSGDMRGLRDFNTAFGEDGADVVLEEFKRLIVENGGQDFDAAHPHGDEFYAQGESEKEIRELFARVAESCAKLAFAQPDLERGGGHVQEGLHFVYGVDPDLEVADREELPKAKLEQGSVPGPKYLPPGEYEAAVARLEARPESEGYRFRRLRPQRPAGSGGVPPGSAGGPAGGVRLDPAGRDRSPSSQGDGGGGGAAEAEGGSEGPAAGLEEVTPETVAEVRAVIGRMQSKERKQAASAFLDFIVDPESNSRPKDFPSDIEAWFFDKFSLFDPVRGPPEVDLRTGRLRFGGDKLTGADTSGKKKTPYAGRKKSQAAVDLMRARKLAGMTAARASRKGFEWMRQEPQAARGDARGHVEFTQNEMMRLFRIVLNPNADLSTFLHEGAHVFLEMFVTLSERPDAPQQFRDDFQAVLRWAGAKKPWSELSKEERVDVHEKFARGFEAYLREGKAPSHKLVGAFQRFRDWLVSIYRSVSSLNVALNDDIRGVFDRLLATDREIEAMKRRMGFAAPLFKSPEEMAQALGRAVATEEWLAYLDAYQRAHSAAQQQLERRVLKDRLREAEGWWKEELARQRDIADLEYESLPARLTQRFLRGTLGDARGEPIHLDRATVEAAVGPQNAKKFRLRKAGGKKPGDFAAQWGFATGEEMLVAVANLQDKGSWTKERAESAMREKFPELLDEHQKLREEAANALHGEPTIAHLLFELRALGGPANREVLAKRAKALAEERRAGKLDAGTILLRERQAADRALQAMAKGNRRAAMAHKLEQVLNALLHRELTQAREDREAFLDLASDLGKSKALARLGKAGPVYRDGILSLLERFGLKDAPEYRENSLPGVEQVVAAMEADGATVMFDVDVVGRAVASEASSWKELSVREMRAVLGALKNIRGAARAKNGSLVDGKRIEKEQAVEQLVAEFALHLKRKGPAATKEAQSVLERAMRLGSSLDGWALRIETMIGFLVDNDIGSMAHRALIQPLQDAKVREVDLLNEVVRPIVEAFEKVPKEVRARFMEPIDGAKLFPNHVENVAAPSRRFELLVLALNLGNEGNLQRLLDGRRMTLAQAEAAVSLLSKEELEWVQSIWDAHEHKVKLPGETEGKSLRDRAFDLEERDSGLRPEPVKARAFEVNGVKLRGGYFPAVYQPEATPLGKRQEAQALADLMDPSFVRPGTPHGHLKKRADKVTQALSLSPGTIYSHLAKAAHDVAFREPLKSVATLILDPAVQESLRAHLGYEKAKLFLPWLRDIGTMRGDIDWGGFNLVAQWMRSNMAPALLGFRPSIPLGDVANLAVAGLDLEPLVYAATLRDFYAAPLKNIEEAKAKSGELRARRSQLSRDLAKAVKELTSGKSKRAVQFYRQHGFVLLEWSDALTSTPAWMASYRQALKEGLSEQDAVRTADRFVRERFPSHSPVDMAHMLRDKGVIGFLTVFGGYTNVLWNRQRRYFRRLATAEGAKDTGIAAGKLLGLWLAANLLSSFLMGRGPREDERWYEWFLRRLVTAPFENFHGELGGAVEALAGGKRPDPRGSPLSSYLETVGGGVVQALNGDADAARRMKGLVNAIGINLGVPVTPINNLIDVLDMKEDEGVLDAVEDALYGERRTATPLDVVPD